MINKSRRKEQFTAELHRIEDQYWNPAPREGSTIVTSNFRSYLIGGLNFEAVKEIAEVTLNGEHVQWKRIDYENPEKVMPRMNHSSILYKELIYIFGGCFMYNSKRMIRECQS